MTTAMFPRRTQDRSFPAAGRISGSVPAALGGTCVAVDYGDGPLIHTLFTCTALSVITGNTAGASFGATQIYDFPQDRIAVFAVSAYFSTITFGADIATAASGDYSLGTTASADATLGGTDVNLLPSSAMLDPFVLQVGRSNAITTLADHAVFDGSATAVDMFLNVIIDDADVSDGAAADPVLFTGQIWMSWMNLGVA